MPTEDGTALHAGRRPRHDATVVSLLKEAGAVIMGKTVTTELAVYAPGKTRNPHDLETNPGGSSSGSAAAVAAEMVPLALGTQTNGSVIRPASYCGVIGYKPTHGLISRTGILRQSRLLDQVGVFARSLADAALLAETLMGFDASDGDMRPRARPRLSDFVSRSPPLPPRFAFVKTPMWEEASTDTQEAFAELVESMGDADDRSYPAGAVRGGRRSAAAIMEADLALSFAPEYERTRPSSARRCVSCSNGRNGTLRWITIERGADRAVQRGAGRRIPRDARHRNAGDDRRGAARTRVDGKPGLLQSVDAVRSARRYSAVNAGRRRHAAGSAAGRPARRRRTTAAVRTLVG